MQLVWLVVQHEYDYTAIVAAYQSEEMARIHAREIEADVDSVELSSALPLDIADPAQQQERALQRDAKQAEARRNYEERERHQARQAEFRRNAKPEPGDRISLCHCATFSRDRYFINEHGHCGYCGGYTPDVFRKQMGEQALISAIDTLEIHDRVKMRQLCGVS
jgi:hypothetical protein